GDWNPDPALARALDMLRADPPDPSRLRRIVMMSCGVPTAGRGSPFARFVDEAEAADVAVSFYGVLLGYDAATARLLGGARGGLFGYLSDGPAVEQVFDEDFDFLMPPVAYDVDFRLDVAEGLRVDRLYGLPDTPDTRGRPAFEVATLHFSQRR